MGGNRNDELTVSTADAEDDAAALHSLYSAVLEDDYLTRARKSLVTGQPREGEMGAEDIIRLVLGTDLVRAPARTSVSCATGSAHRTSRQAPAPTDRHLP